LPTRQEKRSILTLDARPKRLATAWIRKRNHLPLPSGGFRHGFQFHLSRPGNYGYFHAFAALHLKWLRQVGAQYW
jgi:hypothetical protein